MSDLATPTVKRITRRKAAVATETPQPVTVSESLVPSSPKARKAVDDTFSAIVDQINEAMASFTALQKDIAETKDAWAKEQRDHQAHVLERDQQEEITRKRERETYDYETAKKRKQDEDEFLERKAKWERELAARKEELEQEKRELLELRKQVAGLEAEKEKAVKEAITALQKQLQETFATERKLTAQETKAEKEILVLKITNLTAENTRQANEIAAFKQALEDATTQLKDVAVKVIESASTPKALTTPGE